MSIKLRICTLVAGLVLIPGVLCGQSTSQPQAAPVVSSAPAAEAAKTQESGHEATSAKAEESSSLEEEEENAQFKYSPIVKKVAASTGLSKRAVYWTFVVINFAILAAGIVWVVRKALPNGFAPRTAEIRKGIEEAQKASAEASARLSEIEGRLAKFDTEIAELRASAEADFSAEEARIKAAAEQDARNVVAAAEQEIAAATRVAQHELKAFVADLAVDLAEKKISVDDATDQALVRGFAAQLGKDGQ